MKKVIILAVLLTTFLNVHSQDLVIKKDGSEIRAKVLEVTKTEIKFKKFDNLDGPLYTELISDLLMIRYEKGQNEVFQKETFKPDIGLKIPVDLPSTSSENMCDKGAQDARLNYDAKSSGAGLVGVATGLFSPIVGVIAAAAVAPSAPSIVNLNAPTPSLLKNADYLGCYQKEAQKTKSKKVWQACGIGSGVWLVLYAIIKSKK